MKKIIEWTGEMLFLERTVIHNQREHFSLTNW